MTRILLCAALLALAPLPAFAQAYVGTWSSDPAQCRNGQEVEDAPMIIKRDRYDQHETHCVFSGLRQRGDTWTGQEQCRVEGTSRRGRITLKATGDTLSIDEGPGPRRLQRCR